MTNMSILIVFVIAFIAGTITTGTLAYAAEKPNKQPFQALWDAIASLQTQVDEIESNPGPAGPPGEQGPPGVLSFYNKTAGGHNSNRVQVYCDQGDLATGGGFFSANPVYTSQPLASSDGKPIGWEVFNSLFDPPIGHAFVICADITP